MPACQPTPRALIALIAALAATSASSASAQPAATAAKAIWAPKKNCPNRDSCSAWLTGNDAATKLTRLDGTFRVVQAACRQIGFVSYDLTKFTIKGRSFTAKDVVKGEIAGAKSVKTINLTGTFDSKLKQAKVVVKASLVYGLPGGPKTTCSTPSGGERLTLVKKK